eukprot:865533_1
MSQIAEEGKNDDSSDIDALDIDSQIAMKRSLIESVLGKQDAVKLYDDINKEPKKYIDDTRKLVKELATLVLSKSAKNMDTQDLYLLIQTLQSQVTQLQNK